MNQYELEERYANGIVLKDAGSVYHEMRDSGIIGSKQFVSANSQRFRHVFDSKHEKKPKPIKGLDGMYSLKRLSELI